MKPKKPPVTQRFCVVCETNRHFKYNPLFGHSECVICGSRFGKKVQDATH